MPEYTNSVIASRDTNISPREAYDTIRDRASPRSKAERDAGRVLDLGAGAGASTKLLSDIGWREVVAVDPSSLAWDRYSAGGAPDCSSQLECIQMGGAHSMGADSRVA